MCIILTNNLLLLSSKQINNETLKKISNDHRQGEWGMGNGEWEKGAAIPRKFTGGPTYGSPSKFEPLILKVSFGEPQEGVQIVVFGKSESVLANLKRVWGMQLDVSGEFQKCLISPQEMFNSHPLPFPGHPMS